MILDKSYEHNCKYGECSFSDWTVHLDPHSCVRRFREARPPARQIFGSLGRNRLLACSPLRLDTSPTPPYFGRIPHTDTTHGHNKTQNSATCACVCRHRDARMWKKKTTTKVGIRCATNGCKAARKPMAVAAETASLSPPATAIDKDAVHPCPICLVNEDDYGKYCLCYGCGQLYCGDCNVAAKIGRVENCPTCRAPFAVPAEVKVERLMKLLTRSPGRHTRVAQSNLGMMYSMGTGVVQDYTEAVRRYRLAADQGLAMAQSNLGVMYENGTGVRQDHAKAARWFRIAADQGFFQAQCNLGIMYKHGNGVAQDDAEAVRWYRRAADQGLATAQSNLAVMYKHGNGVAQDDAEAARWFRLAADQGLATAQSSLGVMYKSGIGVSQDDAEAAQCFRLAAVQGDADGQYFLGLIYKDGSGVAQNDAEAARWYRLAADQGDADAQYFLGVMYSDGTGVCRDHTEATRLLKLACDQGHSHARDGLAKFA